MIAGYDIILHWPINILTIAINQNDRSGPTPEYGIQNLNYSVEGVIIIPDSSIEL